MRYCDIAVLTPTYNRALLLNNLYESIKNQNILPLEWVIVDDGSKDDTEQLIQDWKRQSNKFNIQYIHQNNGGKHRAINNGVQYVQSKYVYIVDSDDTLPPDAIENIDKYIEMIKNDDTFAGVCGMKGYDISKSLMKFPPNLDYFDGTLKQMYQRNMIQDAAEVIRKDLLLKYPFPEFEGEKFLAEGGMLFQLSHDGYKFRVFREVIYLCKYLRSGLTKNIEQLNLDNWNGFVYNTQIGLREKPIKYKFKALGKFVYFAKKKGLGYKYVHDTVNVNYLFIFLSDIAQGVYRTILKIDEYIKEKKMVN